MLILTRKKGESLFINDAIKVTYLGMFGNEARIGIDAPKEVPIRREELEPLKPIDSNKR